jgi:crotonobetainyl-CoA:carnitine CoA-transferase CaiB-like acyl-CoA transferase
LDLTHFIAGPYCTKLLADFGAEVIKVEKPGEGDGARRLGPFLKDDPHPEKSGFFLYLNTNKKGITLNLKSDSGKSIFKELVKRVDIVVENFEPRVMPSLGLSYDELKGLNPSLVMTSISNFGQSGPYRDYKATDIVAQAMGGLMFITGQPDREPLKIGGSQAQYNGGTAAFTYTLLALYGKDIQGVGQHVDVSIMEAVIGSLEMVSTSYSYSGTIQGRAGTEMYRVVLGTPIALGTCKDGLFLLNAMGVAGSGLTNLAIMVEKPELTEHPFFDTVDSRARSEASWEEFYSLVRDWFEERTKLEIVEKAQELRMAFAPVQTTEDLMKDPQLQARGFFDEIDHPVVGKLHYPGMPFVMSESPHRVGRAPLLGEHNEEVYCKWLGYTKQDLVRLRERRII